MDMAGWQPNAGFSLIDNPNQTTRTPFPFPWPLSQQSITAGLSGSAIRTQTTWSQSWGGAVQRVREKAFSDAMCRLTDHPAVTRRIDQIGPRYARRKTTASA